MAEEKVLEQLVWNGVQNELEVVTWGFFAENCHPGVQALCQAGLLHRAVYPGAGKPH